MPLHNLLQQSKKLKVRYGNISGGKPSDPIKDSESFKFKPKITVNRPHLKFIYGACFEQGFP